MLRNTATCINSNNNIDRNHRISYFRFMQIICILHFLTPSRWKMHIKVRCVFEEYQILKKIYVNLTKNMIKIIETILILSLCKLCIFVNLFMFFFFLFFFFVEFWAGIRLGTWKKIIVVKIYWWNLCYGCLYKNYFPSSDFEWTKFMQIIKRRYV